MDGNSNGIDEDKDWDAIRNQIFPNQASDITPPPSSDLLGMIATHKTQVVTETAEEKRVRELEKDRQRVVRDERRKKEFRDYVKYNDSKQYPQPINPGKIISRDKVNYNREPFPVETETKVKKLKPPPPPPELPLPDEFTPARLRKFKPSILSRGNSDEETGTIA